MYYNTHVGAAHRALKQVGFDRLFMFLTGLVLTLRGLYFLLDEIGRHPVVTSSKLTTRPAVPFPAFTVCNINRCGDRKTLLKYILYTSVLWYIF